MAKKNIIILSIIAFVILLLLVIFLFLSKKTQQSPSAVKPVSKTLRNTATAPFSFPAEDSDKMTLHTGEESIPVNNVYKNPLEKLSLEGVSFKDNQDYYMDFYPDSQGFRIIIYNPDFEATREKAEEDLLSTLGVTKDQACNLRISIVTPVDVNDKLGGKNFGLSFCN